MRRALKFLAFSLGMLLFTFSLFGCEFETPEFETPVQTEEMPEQIAPPAPVVVKLLVSTPTEQLLRSIEAIEIETGIQTELITLPAGTWEISFYKTSLATGDMPDIFSSNMGALSYALNPEENLLDLSNEPFIAALPEKFRYDASINGRLYAIPSSSISFIGWAYNKRVYKQLGLKAPRTWDELMQNCQIIQAAGGIPVIGSYKETTTAQFIFLADHYNVKAVMADFPRKFTEGQAKFATTPCALRSFEKMAEVKKYLNNDCLDTTTQMAIEMLVSGQGAHCPMSSRQLTVLQELYPDEISNIGFFGQPGEDSDNQGITYGLPLGLYVYKFSPNVELARRWLKQYLDINGNDVYQLYQPMDNSDIPSWVNDVQAYFDNGKVSLLLEYESPLKGSTCAQICLETLIGMTDAYSAAVSYDKDVEKQAIQLRLPGW
ncbi:MAG: ABC transporter substrate-binding protein [Synergistaceae bacterium]|nr:ABC transporter substrate-binding protein [Synergistaceae bacterium]